MKTLEYYSKDCKTPEEFVQATRLYYNCPAEHTEKVPTRVYYLTEENGKKHFDFNQFVDVNDITCKECKDEKFFRDLEADGFDGSAESLEDVLDKCLPGTEKK